MPLKYLASKSGGMHLKISHLDKEYPTNLLQRECGDIDSFLVRRSLKLIIYSICTWTSTRSDNGDISIRKLFPHLKHHKNATFLPFWRDGVCRSFEVALRRRHLRQLTFCPCDRTALAVVFKVSTAALAEFETHTL